MSSTPSTPQTRRVPRLAPLSQERVAEDPALAEALDEIEAAMGFIPEDCLVLARRPHIFRAVHQLVVATYRPGEVPMELKRLVGLMTSVAAGCRYCTAHGTFGARRAEIPQTKLDAIWNYETSAHFSPPERAALHVARGAAMTPNAVSDDDFSALALHFDAGQIVEILAVIGLFGFLNRWNATAATAIEAVVAQEIGNRARIAAGEIDG